MAHPARPGVVWNRITKWIRRLSARRRRFRFSHLGNRPPRTREQVGKIFSSGQSAIAQERQSQIRHRHQIRISARARHAALVPTLTNAANARSHRRRLAHPEAAQPPRCLRTDMSLTTNEHTPLMARRPARRAPAFSSPLRSPGTYGPQPSSRRDGDLRPPPRRISRNRNHAGDDHGRPPETR